MVMDYLVRDYSPTLPACGTLYILVNGKIGMSLKHCKIISLNWEDILENDFLTLFKLT